MWVLTARGALARVDHDLTRVLAMARLPGHTTSAIAVGEPAVWAAESGRGAYRADTATNRVAQHLWTADRDGTVRRITTTAGR